MVSESLVKSCLYNWLGYGNVDSPIWFIGTEEGGAEIYREKTQTLESSLALRSKYGTSMDFYNVWEELYGINLKNFKGITVWHFIANFILSLEGKQRNSDNIKHFIFEVKKLGRINSDHFLCELLPLPKRIKESIEDYIHIWSSIKEYRLEVLPKRFDLIKRTLENNRKVKLNKILQSIYEQDFLDVSYGFRPNRNCHDAIKDLGTIIQFKKINYIVDADIKGFFDNVDHKWMMEFISLRIADPNIKRLIVKFLKAGIMENGIREETEVGTPQGSVISIKRYPSLDIFRSEYRVHFARIGFQDTNLHRCPNKLYQNKP